jgi:hypothetical protein
MILENCVEEFRVTWYFIPNTDDAYCVGCDGSVWSRYVNVGGGKWIIGGTDNWRKLTPILRSDGRVQYTLYFDGGVKVVLGHQLVASLFLGPCPFGMECCHEDGNPGNNDVCNLRWDIHRNNEKDKFKHGTDYRGERNPMAVLTQNLADQVRVDYSTGKYTQRDLAKKHGVCFATIHNIVRYKSYVPTDPTNTWRLP